MFSMRNRYIIKQCKEKLKQFTALTLAALISITSIPITVYAENVGDTNISDSAENGGEGSSGETKDYIDADPNWQPVPGFNVKHSGYRIYIINEDLARISPVYDFYFDEPTGLVDAFFDTRFDVAGVSPDAKTTSKRYDMTDLQKWCTNNKTTKEWKNPPTPVVYKSGSGYNANGLNFKDWFFNGLDTLNDDGITYDPNSGSGSGSSGSGSGSGSNSNKNNTGNENDSSTTNRRDETTLDKGIDLYQSANSINRTDVLNSYKQEYSLTTAEAREQLDADIKEIALCYLSLYTYSVKAYWTGYTGMELDECKYASLVKCSNSMDKLPSLKGKVCILALKYMYDTFPLNAKDLGDRGNTNEKEVSSIIPTDSDLTSQNIPLAPPPATTDDVVWTEDRANSPAFVLINSNGTIQIPAKYGDYPGYAIENYNCLLVVEPIFWISVKTDARDDQEHTFNGKYYTKGYVYGSIYNILNYPWKGGHGTYGTLLSVAMTNSLSTTKELVIKSTGNKIETVTPGLKYNPLSNALDVMKQKKGLGMHAYDASFFKKTSSDTSTYDEPQGNTPAPSEDCSTFPEETSYSTLSKKVTIVKNYVTRDSSTGIETIDGNFLRKNTPHTIQLEHEPEYHIEKWETSTEQTAPLTEADNGDKTKSYSSLIQNSSHTQSETANGFTTGTVTLDKTEFILYVKLVRDNTTPPPPTPVNGDYILPESMIARAVSSAGTETGTKQIEIKLTYSFPDISTSCSTGIPEHDYGDWIDEHNDASDPNKVTGKHQEHHCNGASHSAGSVTDSKVTVIAKNENESTDDSKKVIVQSGVDKFKSIMTTVTLDRGTTETATSKDGSHTYYFTIYRHINGEDTLKLAKYNQKQSSSEDTDKNTTETVKAGNAAIVGTLGYGEENSKTSKTRASAGYTQSVSFKFKFDDTNSSDKSTTYTIGQISCGHGSPCGPHYGTGDITSTSEVSETADIAVQVYSGSANRPLHTTVTTPETGTHNEKYITRRKVGLTSKPALSNSTNPTGNNNTGLMVTTGVILKFNPFIKMTFSKASDLKNGNIIKYPVNVLSEHQRELQPNDFAEVDWDYAGDNIHLIDLKSQMWATDERLTNNSASWKQPNSVLKGGSSYQLSIADSNMREVVLRTYQAVVPSTDTFVENGADLTVAKATTAHTDYVTSAIDSFEKLHIVQRVTTEIKTSGILSEQSINCDKVERSGDISFLHNGSNGIASPDEKYYLSKDLSGLNSGASEGDLDVKQLPTTTLYYKVWSDTLGNILIASHDNLDTLVNKLDGTVVLTKNQGVADLTNQTAIALNDRTLVIEKLLNSVERNTGNDTSCDWALDGKWYNESFATYIMIQETTLKLGLKSPSSRGGIIDPKLCPYIKDKNSQGTSAFTSEFTTDSYSEKWGSSNQGKIAEFKTQSIYIKDMNKLLTSKLFYIPNQTVQNSR